MAEEIKIKISGDATGFDAAVKKAQDTIKDLEKGTEEFDQALKEVGVSAGAAFAAITAAGVFAVAQFAEAEEVTLKLEAVIKATGGAAGVTSKEVLDLADSIASQTKFTDEAVASAATMLLTFQRIGGETLPRTTQAAADLATLLKTDVSSAAQLLGAALNDPIEGVTRLRRARIELTDAQEKQIRSFVELGRTADAQAVIIGVVEAKVKGLAKAAADGAAGEFAQFKKSLDELAEVLGKQLAPLAVNASKAIRSVIDFAQKNEPVVKLAAGLGLVAAAVTGLITIVSGAVFAFAKFKAAYIVIGAIAGSTVGSIALIVAAVGSLVAAAIYVQQNWATIFPKLQAIFSSFAVGIQEVGGGLADVFVGILTFDQEKIKAGITKLKETVVKGYQEVFASIPEQEEPRGPAGSTAAAPGAPKDDSLQKKALEEKAIRDKALADKEAARLKEAESSAKSLADAERSREEELQKSAEHASLLAASRAGASDKLISLIKERYELEKQLRDSNDQDEIEQLGLKIAKIQEMEAARAAEDAEQKRIVEEEILASNAEFQALSVEQKEVFREENKALLDSVAVTEKESRDRGVQDSLNTQKTRQENFLANEKKFGTAYAALIDFLENNRYGKAVEGASNLAKLQQSSNATLNTIGKAGALTQIGIDTAKGAIAAYNSFLGIPIVGVALGAAAAGAVIAFGAEQASKVVSAADGGLITGGIPGVDSVPALLAPGELVVPQRNFEEVVNAAAASRSGQPIEGAVGGPAPGLAQQSVAVEISFAGEATRILTARQIENRQLGVSREG